MPPKDTSLVYDFYSCVVRKGNVNTNFFVKVIGVGPNGTVVVRKFGFNTRTEGLLTALIRVGYRPANAQATAEEFQKRSSKGLDRYDGLILHLRRTAF